MKKLAFLLALVLALSCCLLMLAACGDGETSTDASSSAAASSKEASSKAESSAAASSEAVSSEPVEESSEDASSEPVEESSEEPTEYSGPVTENPNGKNLAAGKSYTGADPSTHDDVKKYCADLTDGEAAEDLSTDEGVWFAYYFSASATGDQINAPNQVGTFVLDLEEVYAVSTVKINTFIGNNWGIIPPKSMKVEYSVDGTNYSTLAEKTFTTPEETGTKVEFVEFAGDAPVAAQYIRVTIELQGIFAFLNEIEVY